MSVTTIACSQSTVEKTHGLIRGPIQTYPSLPNRAQLYSGKVYSNNSNIDRVYTDTNHAPLGVSVDNHTIYNTIFTNKSVSPIATAPFPIVNLVFTDDGFIALSSNGQGMRYHQDPHGIVNKSTFFAVGEPFNPQKEAVISGLLVHNNLLVIGLSDQKVYFSNLDRLSKSNHKTTDHNGTSTKTKTPLILPVDHIIELKSRPNDFLIDTTNPNPTEIYSVDRYNASINIISLTEFKRSIFQLAGNSLGDVAAKKDMIVTTDPRMTALNVMTFKPLVTRIYSPLPQVPHYACIEPNNTVVVYFPQSNSIIEYRLDTGVPSPISALTIVSNVSSVHCSNHSIIVLGADKNHNQVVQAIPYTRSGSPAK